MFGPVGQLNYAVESETTWYDHLIYNFHSSAYYIYYLANYDS